MNNIHTAISHENDSQLAYKDQRAARSQKTSMMKKELG